MTDLALGWIKIGTFLSAQVDLVANQVEIAWFTRYPPPNKVKVDSGNEFIAEFRVIKTRDYSMKVRSMTSKNS